VRVRMAVSPGTSTEVLREASTAGLAVMSAALLPREQRLRSVPYRQPELREERRVGHAPVREEVPPVLPNRLPERRVPHAPMLRRNASRSRVLHPTCMGWHTRWMLSVVKPSPLRLWGFLLTVLGGALLAFGSINDWAAVTLGNTVENVVPTKGIDVWQGKVTLALGVLIIVSIVALRAVAAERRLAVAVAIIVLGAIALALALWCAASLGSVTGDAGVATLTKALEQQGASASEALKLITQMLNKYGIRAEARPGLWMTVGGAVLALIGGVVDLLWVRRKAAAGDAIDPDTRPVAAETPATAAPDAD
jgi:hypothetical protein